MRHESAPDVPPPGSSRLTRRWGLTLAAALVGGATACAGSQAAPVAGPPPDGLPEARTRPALSDAEARAGGPLDMDGLRARADAARSLLVPSASVGEVGGEPVLDLVWGDVENHQQGQELFAPDDVLLRFVRRTGQGHDRVFSVVAISATTGQTSSTTPTTVSGAERPDAFAVDLPHTRWAD